MNHLQAEQSARVSVTRNIFIARGLRDFGDGFVAILLPVYLTALGLDAFAIGIVATLALLGSSLITLGIGLVGARRDLRDLLIAAAACMFVTGLVFAAVEAQWAIFLVAFVGTINPSSGSVSIFAPLEQSALSRATPDAQRTKMFARYSLTGALAGAAGAFASGSPDLLKLAGISQLASLQIMFVIYALFGLAGGLIYARLPREPPAPEARKQAALGPSRAIIYKLAALFSMDSFASGFAVQSLIALWLFRKFDVSLTTAGAIFFWMGIFSAFSFPVAAWLAARIGLINTMVYTHIPANLCLIFAAIAPNFEVAIALLMVRAALSQMDVPARSSYVMAVVTPAERPAAASFTAVPRSLAAALSPAMGGALFAAGYDALPLVICGVLKTAYDLALLWTFRHVKPPEEQ